MTQAGRQAPTAAPRRSPRLQPGRRPAPMRSMFAHITPLEAPIVWLAFAAGIATGALATWYLLSRRAAARD